MRFTHFRKKRAIAFTIILNRDIIESQQKTITTKSRFSYSKVLNRVKSLTLADQLRLLEDLKKMIQLREEVAENDRVISAEEIADSEAAGQDYQAGRGEYPPKNSNGSYLEKKLD